MNERHCPRCLVVLRGAKGPTMVVDMCPECGGAFFDLGELSRLVRKQQGAFARLEALVEPDDAGAVPVADTGRLRCPGCAKPMERYEYAYCSNIMLERCADCGGVWVDDGELERIGKHLDAGDDEACQDADRLAPYIAELANSEIRNRAVCATAGMLSRRILFP